MIYLILILTLVIAIMGVVLVAKAAKKDGIIGGAPSNAATVVKPLATKPEASQGQKVLDAILLANLLKTGVTLNVTVEEKEKQENQ